MSSEKVRDLISKNKALSHAEQAYYLTDFHSRMNHENTAFSAWVDRLVDESGENSHSWIIKKLAPCADSPLSSRVIDVGCGTGYLTELLASSYPRLKIIGLDFCRDQIAMAQKHSKSPNATYGVASVLKLPFKNQEVDAVVSHYSLMLFRPIDEALSEMSRALKRGGAKFSLLPPAGGKPPQAAWWLTIE